MGDVDISDMYLECLYMISFDLVDFVVCLYGKMGVGVFDGEGWEGWYVGYI